MGTERRERRSGMEEFNTRLTRVETLVETELGPDGRMKSDVTEVKEVVDRIDNTLSGKNGIGLGERIRNLERNQTFIITGLTATLAAAARVAWEWARSRFSI